MPEWNLEFFLSWILGSKAAQWPVFPSAISVANIASISLLQRSTLPWLWECLGLPWTILNPGKDSSIILKTVAFLNSLPLSDWRRQAGGPRKEKHTLRLAATATAVFWVKSTNIYLLESERHRYLSFLPGSEVVESRTWRSDPGSPWCTCTRRQFGTACQSGQFANDARLWGRWLASPPNPF